MGMVEQGAALLRAGQPRHEAREGKLDGKDVQVKHGLAESLQQLEQETEAFREKAREFLDGLVSHYVSTTARLVVAHAGMKEKLQGRGSGKVREFALYGETTGETDEFGLPVRTTGPPSTGARRWSCTATPRCRNPSG
jgi:protein phosphatase